MLTNLLLAVLLLWETVYSVSFGAFLIKSKNKSGGFFVLFLSVFTLLLGISYFVRFLLI